MYRKNLKTSLIASTITTATPSIAHRTTRDDRAIIRRHRSSTAMGLALRAALWGGTAVALAAPAAANPAGGSVVAGTATITQPKPNVTQVNQSTGSAIINWQSFNVGASETTIFQQPSATSVTLNRVIGPDPSVIAGHIEANGRVVL